MNDAAAEIKYEPRRGRKGSTYRTTDRDGNHVALTAGEDGAIWPKNDAEAEILDGFGLKVHRKALRAAQDAGGDDKYQSAGPDVPDDEDDEDEQAAVDESPFAETSAAPEDVQTASGDAGDQTAGAAGTTED